MANSQLIVEALIDAIKWQESLADANRGLPEYRECMEQAARYRAALKRRTGSRQTPMERALDGVPSVPITELRPRPRPAPRIRAMAEKMTRLIWNAEPRHNWPDGDYIGATCSVCDVRGFDHPKRAPAYCWPHWQEAQRETEWKQAKWEADMIAEYGPYTPKPSPFAQPRAAEERRNG